MPLVERVADFLLAAVVVGIVCVLVGKSVRVLKEDERAVIFRLGRLERVAGPGLMFLLPLIDLARIVNLKQVLPAWRGLSKSEVDAKVREHVLGNIGRR